MKLIIFRYKSKLRVSYMENCKFEGYDVIPIDIDLAPEIDWQCDMKETVSRICKMRNVSEKDILIYDFDFWEDMVANYIEDKYRLSFNKIIDLKNDIVYREFFVLGFPTIGELPNRVDKYLNK